MKEEMIIALAASKTYAMPLAVTLRSMAEANRKIWPLRFFIQHDGFTPELCKKVADSLPRGASFIDWQPIELKLFSAFSAGETDYMSKMSYARLLLPRLLPPPISRVLYLDIDILVLEELEPLLATDLAGATAGAVPDLFLQTDYVKEGLDPEFQRANHFRYKGLPPVRDYFNAGVLLIDLDAWRKERISERAFDYLRRHPASPHMDQDGLNFALDGQWTELPPRWNRQDHYRRLAPGDRSGILHFVTGAKPWLARARSANAGLYDSFRSRTRFRRTPLEKARDAFLRLWTGLERVAKRGFRKGNGRNRTPTAVPLNS